jgi:C4-dicarboxylate-specific signal transduction histidine kinase
MPFNPFSALTSKIFGGLLALSLLTLGPGLLITRHRLAEARETITELVDWRIGIIDAIRIAADNPEIDARTAAAQVQALGVTRVNLTNAVKDQNAAITAIEQESAAALDMAREAEEQRRAAIRRTEALQAELRRRAAAPAPAADMEAEVRRSQDELYEAGL